MKKYLLWPRRTAVGVVTDMVQIESDSRPGAFYRVDLARRSCTCLQFQKRSNTFPINSPHRLCKHLIRAIVDNGIPADLKPYAADICWFAEHKGSFTTRERALIAADEARRASKVPLRLMRL